MQQEQEEGVAQEKVVVEGVEGREKVQRARDEKQSRARRED
jgi:hypothetical protein